MATPPAPRLTCGVCASRLRPKDRYCWFCGTAVMAVHATSQPVLSVAAPAGTRSASLQIGNQKTFALEEQRKLITILFIDLQGSTPLAESLDPEDLRNVLGRYFAVTSRHIQHFGGVIDKYIGDAVMAVFGAPISHEDDAQRAVSAALAIKEDMEKENEELYRRGGVRLVLRTGINTGEVVAGMLTGDVAAAYTVTGDAVNTAQRLESAAPPNEILVSEGTYALANRAFFFEGLPPLTLKGKKDPVPAYRVVGRERRSSPRGGTTLVGRGSELARLYEAFRDGSAGRGQVLHLHGEAGVGKTRLVSEFFSGLAATVPRIRARCTSYEVGTPYALIADIIRRAFGIEQAKGQPAAEAAVVLGLAPLRLPSLESATGLFLEILGYAERSTLDPESKRRQLLSVLRQLTARWDRAGSFVVAVEDTHWIDAASASVLAQVIADFPTLHGVFLSTSRDDEAIWNKAVRMPLDALDEAGSNEMIDRVAHSQIDEGARALILERTAGNPFFIEEVVRGLESGRTKTVPATVQEVLEARFDGLNESPRRVAQRASVIGRTFWLRILARVAIGEPLEPALAALESDRFIVARELIAEPTYAFRHALVQEVVYGSQLMSQRRVTHGIVGAALEEHFANRVEEFTDTLAFHYDKSDDDDKALFWLARAGDRAKALFANEDALRLYEAALRRAPDGEGPLEAGTILERIGEVQTASGHYDDAIARFGAARARIPDPPAPTVARLHRKIGMALRSKGSYPAAFRAFEEGHGALAGVEDLEGARIGIEVGQLHWRSANYAAASDALSEAIALGERVGADDVVAEGLRHLGTSYMHGNGDLKRAEETYLKSLAIYERLEDIAGIAEVRNNLGIVYRRMGRWDDALAACKAGLALRERTGNPWRIAMSYNNLGELHRMHYDMAQAGPAYERAISTFRGIGAAVEAAAALMNLGAARVEAGEVAQGRADLIEAERQMSALGNTQYQPGLYRYLASAELAAGNVEEAGVAAERSLELSRTAKSPHLIAMAQRALGEIAIARGQLAAAKELLETSRTVLAEHGEVGELRQTEAVLQKLDGLLK
jgi:adenylate cyclase